MKLKTGAVCVVAIFIVGIIVCCSQRSSKPILIKEEMHKTCIETMLESAPPSYRADNSYFYKVKTYCDCYIEKYFDEIDLDTKTFKRYPNLNKKDEDALDTVLNEIDKRAIEACVPLIIGK